MLAEAVLQDNLQEESCSTSHASHLARARWDVALEVEDNAYHGILIFVESTSAVMAE